MSELLSTKQTESPAILKNRSLLGSDAQLILKIEAEASRAVHSQHHEFGRAFREWRAYTALEGGQWPGSDLVRMSMEDRTARQFNIIGPKVDTLVGAMKNEIFDFDWAPVEGKRTSLTESVKNSYYADKEGMNYDREILGCIRDGVVHLGVLKMFESRKLSPLKNIGIKKCMPGFVVFDPFWITDNDEDCEMSWEFFHLNALQIQQTYGTSNPRIEEEIRFFRRTGGDWSPLHLNQHASGHVGSGHGQEDSFSDHTGSAHTHRPGRKGHLFRVMEHHWMERVKVTRVIGRQIDTELRPGRWIPFPITSDHNRLQQFMLLNNVMPETMVELPYEDRIHHLETICPELTRTEFLERGISNIQIKRLPYFQFTANRVNGRNKGIVGDMMDIQETINKREEKITSLIATAQGGGKLVNRDLFKSDPDRRRFQEEGNDPGYVEFVDGEELTKENSIVYVNSNQFPSQVVDQLNRMWDIVDRVSKVSQSLEAITEGSKTSGVLFDRQLQVSKLILTTITQNLKNLNNNLAEAYLYQWQITYDGPQRELSTNNRENVAILNEQVVRDGRIFIKNRPGQIGRTNVIVTESDKSLNIQMRNQRIFGELYKTAVETNPEYASFFFGKLMKTMDLSDDEKEELKRIATLQKLRDIQKIIADVKTLDSQGKQADFAGLQAQLGLQQLTGQAGGAPGEPGGPGGEVEESLTEQEPNFTEAIAESEVPGGEEEIPAGAAVA